MFNFIKNKDSNRGYHEHISYSLFKGLELIEPEEGKGYDISVEPESERIVIIRFGNGYDWGDYVDYKKEITMSPELLVSECLEKGSSSERTEGITFHSMQFDGGQIMVYAN